MANTSTNELNKLSELGMVFREQFFEKMRSLYEAEQLCDVTLIASGKRIPAHRIMLSAATPYFSAMFTSELKEKNQQEITLHEVHGNEIKSLIDFCYNGHININEMNAFELLETASRIEFSLIENACAQFLRDKLNASNCLNTWILTERYLNLNELTTLALKLVEENFVEIAETHEFLLLDVNHLKTLLIRDGLNVFSEEEVFNALTRWVNYDKKNRKPYAKDLLMIIRFSKLKLSFLSENVNKFCKQIGKSALMKEIYQLKAMPKTRSLVSSRPSTLVKRLIAIGNDSSASMEDRSIETYCPIKNKWKNFEQFKCYRTCFSSVVLGDELFIMGGFSTRSNSVLKSVEKYNFSMKQLMEVEPMNKARSSFQATVLNNEIFVAGGDETGSVEKFNLKTGKWTEIPKMLVNRKCFALVSVNGKLIAVGGRSSFILRTVECYDTFENKWKFIASLNEARCSHSVAVHKNLLYAIGGVYYGCKGDSPEYYDPSINKWTMIETLTIPRFQFDVAIYDDFIVVAGGTRNDKVNQSSAMKINLENLTIEDISSMNHARSCFSLIEMPCYDPSD